MTSKAHTAVCLGQRRIEGVIAVLLVAVFPGNLSQLADHRSALGFDTELKRVLRLQLQPALIAAVPGLPV